MYSSMSPTIVPSPGALPPNRPSRLPPAFRAAPFRFSHLSNDSQVAMSE